VSLTDDVSELRHLSVLRLLDIVIWMREQGWKWAPDLSDFAELAPISR
jgi:hypothetical protein